MLRWIFWILIIIWLISKIKSIFEENTSKRNDAQYKDYTPKHNSSGTTNHVNKKLKNDAGEYVDYEELK